MKYFYDTEFHERGEGYPIELISIGMVAEDGRELYAVLSDFDWHSLNDSPSGPWLKKHVLPYCEGAEFNAHGMPSHGVRMQLQRLIGNDPSPEFWAYYGAYDHVVLCQLFGRMVDLPRNFPMFTHDIKQLMGSLGISKDQLPKQETGHHRAIDDARWVKAAWEWISGLSANVTEVE